LGAPGLLLSWAVQTLERCWEVARGTHSTAKEENTRANILETYFRKRGSLLSNGLDNKRKEWK
jgi:hypothetical protein